MSLSKLHAALAIAGLLSTGWAHAADPAAATGFKAENERIEATAKAEKEACKGMEGNAKDICEAEAKAKEKVAKAELRYKTTGNESDRVKVAEVKAEADYEVAKERCEDMEGDQQRACKKEAKAAEKAAKAEARAALKKPDGKG